MIPRRFSIWLLGTVLTCIALHSPLSAELVLSVMPERYWSPLPGLYASGSSLTLQSSGAVEAGAQFAWFHDGMPISGATGPNLTLSNLSVADSGIYHLQVTTAQGVETSAAVTVNVVTFPPSPVDRTFNLTLGADFRYAIPVAFADDGSFVAVTNAGYIRVRTDGSRDAGFLLPSGVEVLAVLPDGGLILSSSPYHTNAEGTPAGFTLPAAFDSTKPLTAAAVQPDGRLLIAQGTKLARLNADGSLDGSFSFVPREKAVSVKVTATDGRGRLYVSEVMDDGVPGNEPWPIVSRLNTNGERDSGFADQEGHLRGSFDVVPLPDGRIFYHTFRSGSTTYRMLRDDGTFDPAWPILGAEGFPVVDAARAFLYQVEWWGGLKRYRLGATGLEPDATFYPGVTVDQMGTKMLDRQGRLLVQLLGPGAVPNYHLVRVNTGIVTVRPPIVSVNAWGLPIVNGGTVTLQSRVFGTGPLTYEWRALDGQPLPADHFSAELRLTSFRAAMFGRYQLKVTGPGGSVLSDILPLAVDTFNKPFLANLSGRAHTGQGENTVVAGLVAETNGYPIQALVRGVGPTLRSLGVAEAMPDPAIDVFDRTGTLIANNDQWAMNPDTAAAGTQVGAFSLKADADAALLHSFPRGSSTIMLKDQGGGQHEGVGLIEVYQMDRGRLEGGLLNLSLRARTAPGDSVAVAGFVISDPLGFGRPLRVLLRAVGPTLATQGISHPLENPVLDVFNVKGEKIASNDDWAVANTSGDQATLAAAMTKVGAFALPATSKDAALLLDLPAGVYTMHGNGGTGVVLLEIYLVK